MARLSPELLRSRLAYDHEVVRELRSPILRSVRAFGSEQDRRAGRELTPADAAAGNARFYLVEYAFRILIGADRTTDHAVARFDLLAGGNYPFTEPLVTIESRPLPWSPHVHPATGLVCLGKGWSSGGTALAAQLVVHVARMLNCDEPDRGPGYEGWNGDAAGYWRRVLKCRPLNELEYPRLPVHLTHGISDDAGFRRVAAGSAGFVPLVVAPGESLFARAPAIAGLDAEPAFRPVRVAL